MRETIERLGQIWCGVMHDSPMWPIHNRYQCRRCGRQRPVAWAGPDTVPPKRTPEATTPILALHGRGL